MFPIFLLVEGLNYPYIWHLEKNLIKKIVIDSEKEEEEIGMVDFEGELISDLDELKKVRKKNRKLKEQLQHAEDGMYNLDNEDFVYQKEKLEEAIKSKDNLALLLEEK